MARHSLEVAQRVLRRLLRQLEKPEDLEHSFAEEILKKAVQNASGKPTPQARMAASVLDVDNATIFQRAPAGTPPVDVAIGSEFGSHIWPQFHRSPNNQGYWLWPATRDPLVIREMDKDLEQVLEAVIRRG